MQQTVQKSNKVLSNGAIYFIGSIISQLVNILLIPIYTSNLSVEDVGLFSLITTIQSFLGIFITLGIYSGLVRYFNNYDDKNLLKNIALTFSLIWGTIFIPVIVLFSPLLSTLLSEGDSNSSRYIIIITIVSLVEAVLAIYGNYFSMQFKALASSGITIGNMFLKLIISAFFIISLNRGITGLLEGQLLASTLVLLFLIIIDLKKIKLVIKKDILSKMLAYGVGLAPGQVSVWILTLIDRYFLKELLGLVSVGIYSMAYKIGMLINPIFIIPFTKVFTPIKFKVYSEPEGKKQILKLFNYYNVLGWFVILGLSLFASFALNLLATKDYEQGFILVPLIALSYFIWGLGEFYALGLHIANKMTLNSLIVTIAAVLNVVLNLALIPYLGMSGAALATILAYFAGNILYYLIGKKYYDLNLTFFEPYKSGLIATFVYLIYLLFKQTQNGIIIEFIVNIFLCVLYLILCYGFNLLSSSDLEKVKSITVKLAFKFKKGRA